MGSIVRKSILQIKRFDLSDSEHYFAFFMCVQEIKVYSLY